MWRNYETNSSLLPSSCLWLEYFETEGNKKTKLLTQKETSAIFAHTKKLPALQQSKTTPSAVGQQAPIGQACKNSGIRDGWNRFSHVNIISHIFLRSVVSSKLVPYKNVPTYKSSRQPVRLKSNILPKAKIWLWFPKFAPTPSNRSSHIYHAFRVFFQPAGKKIQPSKFSHITPVFSCKPTHSG